MLLKSDIDYCRPTGCFPDYLYIPFVVLSINTVFLDRIYEMYLQQIGIPYECCYECVYTVIDDLKP